MDEKVTIQCNACGSEWSVSADLAAKTATCPFCGAALPKKEEEQPKDMADVVACVIRTFGKQKLAEPKVFFSLVQDFIPVDLYVDTDKRVLRIALDSGVYERILSVDPKEYGLERELAIRKLTGQFAMALEWAARAVDWVLKPLGYSAPPSPVPKEPEVSAPVSKRASSPRPAPERVKPTEEKPTEPAPTPRPATDAKTQFQFEVSRVYSEGRIITTGKVTRGRVAPADEVSYLDGRKLYFAKVDRIELMSEKKALASGRLAAVEGESVRLYLSGTDATHLHVGTIIRHKGSVAERRAVTQEDTAEAKKPAPKRTASKKPATPKPVVPPPQPQIKPITPPPQPTPTRFAPPQPQRGIQADPIHVKKGAFCFVVQKVYDFDGTSVRMHRVNVTGVLYSGVCKRNMNVEVHLSNGMVRIAQVESIFLPNEGMRSVPTASVEREISITLKHVDSVQIRGGELICAVDAYSIKVRNEQNRPNAVKPTKPKPATPTKPVAPKPTESKPVSAVGASEGKKEQDGKVRTQSSAENELKKSAKKRPDSDTRYLCFAAPPQGTVTCECYVKTASPAWKQGRHRLRFSYDSVTERIKGEYCGAPLLLDAATLASLSYNVKGYQRIYRDELARVTIRKAGLLRKGEIRIELVSEDGREQFVAEFDRSQNARVKDWAATLSFNRVPLKIS